jgi:predicted  nucleic acid-binding Zn-ribbon protein
MSKEDITKSLDDDLWDYKRTSAKTKEPNAPSGILTKKLGMIQTQLLADLKRLRGTDISDDDYFIKAKNVAEVLNTHSGISSQHHCDHCSANVKAEDASCYVCGSDFYADSQNLELVATPAKAKEAPKGDILSEILDDANKPSTQPVKNAETQTLEKSIEDDVDEVVNTKMLERATKEFKAKEEAYQKKISDLEAELTAAKKNCGVYQDSIRTYVQDERAYKGKIKELEVQISDLKVLKANNEEKISHLEKKTDNGAQLLADYQEKIRALDAEKTKLEQEKEQLESKYLTDSNSFLSTAETNLEKISQLEAELAKERSEPEVVSTTPKADLKEKTLLDIDGNPNPKDKKLVHGMAYTPMCKADALSYVPNSAGYWQFKLRNQVTNEERDVEILVDFGIHTAEIPGSFIIIKGEEYLVLKKDEKVIPGDIVWYNKRKTK